jgi:hypothetical protein
LVLQNFLVRKPGFVEEEEIVQAATSRWAVSVKETRKGKLTRERELSHLPKKYRNSPPSARTM